MKLSILSFSSSLFSIAGHPQSKVKARTQSTLSYRNFHQPTVLSHFYNNNKEEESNCSTMKSPILSSFVLSSTILPSVLGKKKKYVLSCYVMVYQHLFFAYDYPHTLMMTPLHLLSHHIVFYFVVVVFVVVVFVVTILLQYTSYHHIISSPNESDNGI